jgi:hypothetical protein
MLILTIPLYACVAHAQPSPSPGGGPPPKKQAMPGHQPAQGGPKIHGDGPRPDGQRPHGQHLDGQRPDGQPPERPGDGSPNGTDVARPGAQAPRPTGAPGMPPRPTSDPAWKARREAQAKAHRPAIQASVTRKPMDDTLRQEMHRHSERVARLERIVHVAKQSGDTASAARAQALIEQENARYQRYLASRS